MIVFITKPRFARRTIVFSTNWPVIQMSKGAEGLPDTIGPTSELITESIKRLSARDTPTTGTEPASEDERPARNRKQKHHKKPKSDDYSDYDDYDRSPPPRRRRDRSPSPPPRRDRRRERSPSPRRQYSPSDSQSE